MSAAAEAIYRYENAAGAVVLEAHRLPGKKFMQRDPRKAAGEWGLLPDTARPVYRLPRVHEHLAANRAEPLFVVEGEKDAHALEGLGFTATCNPMGAGKWTDEHSEQLAGARNVAILADDDEPGRAHAQSVAASLGRVGVAAKVIELWPKGGSSHHDVSDWLKFARDDVQREQARKLLLQIVAEVPAWRPEEAVEEFRGVETPSAPFEYELLSARDVCGLPDPPLDDQLLGPIVARRYRTIVAAGTGEGKTTFSLCLIEAIVNAGQFLGWQGAGGRALVIDLEQGLRTVKRRLRETGLAESDRVDYVRVPDGLALDRDHAQQDGLAEILRSGGYSVVLLDPLYKAHRGDSLDERAIVDLMRLLDRWREQYGFGLILPAHTRKKLEPSAKLTIDDIFGSSATVRGAEIVVGIQRLASGFSRLHWFKDRDGDDTIELGGHWNLLFDREIGYRRDPNDTAPPRDLAAEIQAWLIQSPHATTNAIVAGVGAGKGRVSKILKEDARFTFEPGPNNARLWVVRAPENHSDHPPTTEKVSGGPTGGLSIESHPQTTHHPGGPVNTDHSHPRVSDAPVFASMSVANKPDINETDIRGPAPSPTMEATGDCRS